MLPHSHRGTDDSRAIAQFGRDNGRVHGKQRHPLICLARDAATDDEGNGIEQPRVLSQDFVDALRPL